MAPQNCNIPLPHMVGLNEDFVDKALDTRPGLKDESPQHMLSIVKVTITVQAVAVSDAAVSGSLPDLE
jgi:hypothetical protein